MIWQINVLPRTFYRSSDDGDITGGVLSGVTERPMRYTVGSFYRESLSPLAGLLRVIREEANA